MFRKKTIRSLFCKFIVFSLRLLKKETKPFSNGFQGTAELLGTPQKTRCSFNCTCKAIPLMLLPADVSILVRRLGRDVAGSL